MLDIRPDDQLYKQNLEELNIDKLIDSISFSPVESVTTEKYNGKVYDLKIKNHKNYQIGMGLVHNGGKRKGAAAVYLDTWHPDIIEFLELRDNTGDREKRAYNLNLANWIPDLFMKRVESEGIWSLFDPGEHPELVDTFGEEFEKIYTKLEAEGKYTTQISARKIYAKMMKTLAETGNGWITFKDTCNIRCNSAVDGHVVHSSNLCFSGDTIVRARIAGEEMDIAISLIASKFKYGEFIEVLSFNEVTQKFEWMPIRNAGITSYSSEVIEIYDNDKLLFECTPEHLILTERGWIKAENLEENDSLIKSGELRAVHRLEMYRYLPMDNDVIADQATSK